MSVTDLLSHTDNLIAYWLVLGAAGSLVEKVGLALNSPKLIGVGKTLESLSIDLPKFVGVFLSAFRK